MFTFSLVFLLRQTPIQWHPFQDSLDSNEARDDGVAVALAGPSANEFTLLQTDNHASVLSLNILHTRCSS